MCRTCDLRNAAMQTGPATSVLLNVCLITFHLKKSLESSTKAYEALNTVLNNIVDAEESTYHPSVFTTW